MLCVVISISSCTPNGRYKVTPEDTIRLPFTALNCVIVQVDDTVQLPDGMTQLGDQVEVNEPVEALPKLMFPPLPLALVRI